MLGSLVGSLIPSVTGLLDKFIEDKDQKNALAHEIATMAEKQAHEIAKGQMEINAIEAKSSSIFKSGWRPFTAWVCAVAMAYHFLLQPIILFVASAFGYNVITPEFDMSTLMTVLMGLLGLGGMRSYEKRNGITK